LSKNYRDITRRVSGSLGKLRADTPDVLKAFSALSQAATRDGALDKKTKELIALALGVAAHCDACIGFTCKLSSSLAPPVLRVEEALGMAVYMGGIAWLMYAADALETFEESSAS
jgi:alkylhydroperoxidase/carboxymuconolactone decarboxylase family protein YurZ